MSCQQNNNNIPWCCSAYSQERERRWKNAEWEKRVMKFKKGFHLHDRFPELFKPELMTVDQIFNTTKQEHKNDKREQWVNLKKESQDVILVHIGRFYEVFHHDADIVCDLSDAIYMKGVNAHTGFPESVLHKYIDLLEAAGHTVKII